MTAKLNHHVTSSLQRVKTVGGDLLLLPEDHVGSEFDFSIFDLEDEYAEARVQGHEPSWVYEQPIHVQAKLRLHYARTYEDPFAVVNALPYTGISYMIINGGLCSAAAKVFRLHRLQGINQLGFLRPPWLTGGSDSYYHWMPLTETTRFLHSLDVMTVATLMGTNVHLSASDINTLRLAALTHDMATPAGGDSVKLVDPKRLDEDVNYALVLDRSNPAELLRAWNVNRDDLLQTIRNEGTLGQILDIADKIAYTARDAASCAFLLGTESVQSGLAQLRQIVTGNQHVCSIWDSVRLHDGNIVFADARRLVNFLRLRTLMFREVYYHPRAKFGEYLISRILVKAMYRSGNLTLNELLEMTDAELMRRVDKEYGCVSTMQSTRRKERCRVFQTEAEAQSFANELKAKGNPFVLIENHSQTVKSCTDLPVLVGHKAKPLREAYPGDAREIESMAQILPTTQVYYLAQEPALARSVLAALYESLADKQ